MAVNQRVSMMGGLDENGFLNGSTQQGRFRASEKDFWKFSQDKRGTYENNFVDSEAEFEDFVQANPNLDSSFVNAYRNMLTGPKAQASGGGQQANPYQNNAPLTLPSLPSTGPSNTAAYGGLALGGLLSGDLTGALQGAAGYYAGQEGIEGALGAGTAGFNLSEQLGKRASDATQFKPFGVTSNLANVQTGANGGLNVNLSPQQQALQGQLMGGAGQLAGNLGGQYNPMVGQMGNQAYGQAQNFLGRSGQFDPSVAAQRGAMGGLFGQQQSEYGQPTGMEGITQAGLSGALGQLGSAGQPSDLQSLRSQYGQLAQQAGQGLMMSPQDRQADIYESIRATQRPEEERQNLALEERLLGQGRLGISTDAYGGTPEQLAMAKAQAEAGNTASLMARQQSMAEQQQAMQNAQSLTGMTSDLAQVGSGLESEGISRGTTLANLGLTGTQASNQMNQQQLKNLMALQGADQGAAGVQQQLQQGNFNLGQGMFGLGNQAAMFQGQLQGQDLQLMQAMMNAGYQPQDQALNMFGSGLSSAELAQRGQQRGAELQAVTGGQGIESYMQGANMANLLQQQQMQGLMSSAFGQAPTMQEQLINRLLNPNSGMLTNEGGVVNQGINYVLDKFGGGSTAPALSMPSTPMDSWLGGSSFYDSIMPNSSSINDYMARPAIPTSSSGIDLSNIQAPSNFGYQPQEI